MCIIQHAAVIKNRTHKILFLSESPSLSHSEIYNACLWNTVWPMTAWCRFSKRVYRFVLLKEYILILRNGLETCQLQICLASLFRRRFKVKIKIFGEFPRLVLNTIILIDNSPAKLPLILAFYFKGEDVHQSNLNFKNLRIWSSRI